LITLTTTIIVSSIISIMVSNSNSTSIISIINRVVFGDYSDETPSIIPRKSDEIGESRKGVAVYFPPGVFLS